MKHVLSALILLIIISFVACKKGTGNDTTPVDTFKASANAKLNGEDWSPSYADGVYFYYNEDRFSLLLSVYDGDIKKMAVNVSNIYFDKELNIIHMRNFSQGKDSCYGSLAFMDDDVTLAVYEVLTGADEENFVSISKYDPAKRTVEGSLSASFYKKNGDTFPDFGDTIRFTGGTFKVKIRKEN